MTTPETPVSPYPSPAPMPAPTVVHPTSSSGFAMAALIVGIVAFISGLAPVWGLLAGGAAVGLGVMALLKKQNKALALIGAILGAIAFLSSLLTTLALVVAIAGGGVPQAAQAPESVTDSDSTQVQEATSEPAATVAPEPAPTQTAEPVPAAPAETVSQKNAKRSANSYLDFTAFSRSGLIDQLIYEGFSTEDATYGVDAVGADWSEQAVASAKSYLEFTAFSHSGLVDQLIYEGFTPEQAEYGVSANGL